MQSKRSRWLFILGVVAAMIGIVAVVAPAGGASRVKHRVKHRSVCRAPAKLRAHVSAISNNRRDVKHEHTHVYILCGGAKGKPGTPGAPGQPGAKGPPGGTGPAGAKPQPQSITIPTTPVPFATDSNGNTAYFTDGGNPKTLAQVGPIHFDGICRHVQAPSGSTPGVDEAQVVVWSETGSLSFKGQVGHRENVPPGAPNYADVDAPKSSTNPNPVIDPVAGEGQHIFITAQNLNRDQIRNTDPETDPGHQTDPGVVQLPQYPYFESASGFVGTSDGHLILASLFGGLDVMGLYNQCVFAGTLLPVS